MTTLYFENFQKLEDYASENFGKLPYELTAPFYNYEINDFQQDDFKCSLNRKNLEDIILFYRKIPKILDSFSFNELDDLVKEFFPSKSDNFGEIINERKDNNSASYRINDINFIDFNSKYKIKRFGIINKPDSKCKSAIFIQGTATFWEIIVLFSLHVATSQNIKIDWGNDNGCFILKYELAFDNILLNAEVSRKYMSHDSYTLYFSKI